MRNVQITLDEDLLIAVDKAAKRIRTTRSAFTRDGLRSALSRIRVKELSPSFALSNACCVGL